MSGNDDHGYGAVTDRDAQLTPAQLMQLHDRISWEDAFKEAGIDQSSIRVIRGVNYSFGDDAEQDVHLYGTLTDGRWFIASAGCDTTGWDCMAGGEHRVAPTYEDLVRLEMTSEERVMFLDAPMAAQVAQ